MNFFVFLQLLVNSSIIWILIEYAWFTFKDIVYEFTVPWVVWGTLMVFISIKLIRISPPDSKITNEIMGVDPLVLKKENGIYEASDNENEFCMRVVAHRGGGLDYPENSMTAIQNCIEKGCKAVEFDLALSKDNIPIIFHDSTIERLTGKEGKINEMTWEELKTLDISSNHPLKNKLNNSETIALFDDVLKLCLNHDVRIIIDLKETSHEIEKIILDSYKKYPILYRRAIISSFYPVPIYKIRRKDPNITCSVAWRPDYFSRHEYLGINGLGHPRYGNPFKHLLACLMDFCYEWALSSLVYYILGISAILLHKDIINQPIIQYWKDRNIRVMAWSVNRPSEKLHFSNILKITYLTDTLLAVKSDM